MTIKNRLFSTSFFSEHKKKIRGIYGKTTNINFLLAIVPIFWIFVFFIIPLIIILHISFSESVFKIPPYTEVFIWTKEHFLQICLNLHNYFVLLKDSYYKTAFINSISISTVSTLLCLILGYMMAYGITNVAERKRPILILLISMSFWTSFLIRIYSWINLLSVHGFVNSMLMKFHIIDVPIKFIGNYYAICLGMVFCYLPFMIFPIYAVLEKVDKSYVEAASDLGSHPFRTFWAITVPLTKYGIITGCVLVFTTTIGEFVIPELLGGADAVTVGRVLWIEFFDNIDWSMACALSVVLALFIIFPVLMLQKRTGINEKL